MKKHYGLIGYPLGHSLSPQIHKRLFELDGIEAEYEMMEIPPENLRANFDRLKNLDGFNITIPHKINILGMCNGLSETAQRYGSVNTVKIENSSVMGYNTDAYGLLTSISNMGTNSSKNICLLGCGGVGRMAAIEGACLAPKLTIAAREEDIPVAERLKQHINTELTEVTNCDVNVIRLSEVKGGFDLVINATPVGMYPNVDASPLEKEQLDGVKFLFDVVYNPNETMLMRYARELGIKAQGGMSMLVLQAVAAHKVWLDAHYNRADIDQLIADMEKLV
ncbi:MAG: shikimate dehydrogenase [Oscillospiraceae bacterium]|nr:shikimate dehydrogenase [Oscillospiraceae bacterium]